MSEDTTDDETEPVTDGGDEAGTSGGHDGDIDADSKQDQLDEVREHPDGEYLTTDHGTRLEDTDDSLTAGAPGPTLMEDFHFREKMTHFDHERIPERVVHARGTGAYGYFQPYEDPDLGDYDAISELTKAGLFQDPDRKIPVFTRFSTVVGFRGSADTVRDVRGFATKFYTEEGNWDLVGNNMPVFFIQDAIKFPDLVHAIKPEPDDEMPQASAAHDTFWDFASLTPESTHMLMWVLSDRALPRAYRMMEGFGVHTFRLVDEDGGTRLVKFHWKPVFGTHQLVWDETQKLAGTNPDFNREDLYDAIEHGTYPEYELGVQIVEEDDVDDFDFDHRDPTKIFPEEDVPVRPIGKMVLNETPDNFFAEVEQAAFHPGNVVPGIDFTDDPLLQGRLFSYQDTQLNRFNGANWDEVPVNRPLAERHNNQRDGFMRQRINEGRVSYSPNSLEDDYPREAPEDEGGYVHVPEEVEGPKTRDRHDSFDDHFSQARLFWNSLTEPEQDHLVSATHFELGKVDDHAVKKRVVYELLNNVDHELAVRAAEGIDVELPDDPGEHLPDHDDASPALSMTGRGADSIAARKVAIVLEAGFTADHVAEIRDRLEDRDARVSIVSSEQGPITGADGHDVAADENHETTGSIMFDAVVVPGGSDNVDALRNEGDATHFVMEAFKHKKPIGALGEGVDLLSAVELPNIDLSDDGLESDAGVVTDADAADLDDFLDAFADAIVAHRHWDREDASVPA